jgi:hypothetical protein
MAITVNKIVIVTMTIIVNKIVIVTMTITVKVTRTSLKTGGELRRSERVSSS